jgi:hypothetical protein
MWSFGLVGWVGFESPHTHKRAKSKKLYLFLKKKVERTNETGARWLVGPNLCRRPRTAQVSHAKK